MDIEREIASVFSNYVRDALKKAEKDFGKWQQIKIKSMFDKAIDKFYEDYTPISYERKEGLYALLNLPSGNENGAILKFSDDYSDLYDEESMHSGRKGYDGLFELVFVEGYHGGAKSISADKAKVWGEHPDGETPYWRRRGFVRALRRWHKYGRWGRPAKKAPKSPKDMMKQFMDDAMPEMQEFYLELSDAYVDRGFVEFCNKELDQIVSRWLDF